MPAELVDRLATLVAVRRVFGMGDADSRSLRCYIYVRMQHFDLLMFPFDGFGGRCGENSCNVFLPLFMLLWVPIFAMPCMRAVPMLWHAFLFLGLRHVWFFPPFSFVVGGFDLFFL
jgi:hypothetical protein